MNQGKLNILVVDDEKNIRKTLSYCLESEGHTVIAVADGQEALAEARRFTFDIAFIDLRLERENGLDLIPQLLAETPWLKIVVITANASIETAVEAMRRGAADYIEKPFTSAQIKLLIRTLGHIRDLENELTVLREDRRRFTPESLLYSKNPDMLRIVDTVHKAAASEAMILIRGESGTGKSVFARTIHNLSKRARRPMMIVSCPAVPGELLESELFGHCKGAFTGAVKDNPGRIAACEGGTLFLDEIGDMALPIQAKLLRFIQDKEYERVGDPVTRRADVRILAATNRDLGAMVAQGQFREDLLYRLNVIVLNLPPLRERAEDILGLAERFLARFVKDYGRPARGFSEAAREAMRQYPWPGNVRELRNVIERASIICNQELVDVDHLGFSAAQSASSAPRIGESLSLEDLEKAHITAVMASSATLDQAAKTLGIDASTLYRKRKQYGL